MVWTSVDKWVEEDCCVLHGDVHGAKYPARTPSSPEEKEKVQKKGENVCIEVMTAAAHRGVMCRLVSEVQCDFHDYTLYVCQSKSNLVGWPRLELSVVHRAVHWNTGWFSVVGPVHNAAHTTATICTGPYPHGHPQPSTTHSDHTSRARTAPYLPPLAPVQT